jgi:hypothetical protein
MDGNTTHKEKAQDTLFDASWTVGMFSFLSSFLILVLKNFYVDTNYYGWWWRDEDDPDNRKWDNRGRKQVGAPHTDKRPVSVYSAERNSNRSSNDNDRGRDADAFGVPGIYFFLASFLILLTIIYNRLLHVWNGNMKYDNNRTYRPEFDNEDWRGRLGAVFSSIKSIFCEIVCGY